MLCEHHRLPKLSKKPPETAAATGKATWVGVQSPHLSPVQGHYYTHYDITGTESFGPKCIKIQISTLNFEHFPGQCSQTAIQPPPSPNATTNIQSENLWYRTGLLLQAMPS